MQADRLRLQAAGLLDPRPEAAHGAQLRHAQELVRIGHEQEGEQIASALERMAMSLQSTKIGHADGKRRRELLRFAGSGLVKGTCIDPQHRPFETLIL